MKNIKKRNCSAASAGTGCRIGKRTASRFIISFKVLAHTAIHNFQRQKLRNKFLFAMITLTFLSIIIVTAISVKTSIMISRENYQQTHQSNLVTASSKINLLMQPIISAQRQFLSDASFMDLLASMKAKRSVSASDLIKMDNFFAMVMSGNQYINSIYFISNENYIFYYGRNAVNGTLDTAQVDNFYNQNWYRQTVQAKGLELFFCGDFLDVAKDGSSVGPAKNILSTKLICDAKDSSENYGVIVLNLSRNLLSEVFVQSGMAESGDNLIIDEKTGQYVFDSNTGANDQSYRDFAQQEVTNQAFSLRGYMISSEKNETTGWMLYNIMQEKIIDKKSNQIIENSVVVCALMLIVVFILSYTISFSINRPLKKLEGNIAQVAAGNRNITENFDDSEIGRLGESFKQLVNNNIEIESKLMREKVKQRESELKALQHQINPHFLYNTLDTLYWMATINGQGEIADMVDSLSSIFKLTLHEGEDIISVKDEILYIQCYLNIQKTRYQDKLSPHIEVESEIMDEKIMKLILQPFVENSICHGIEPSIKNCSIWITGKKADDCLVFCVRDNGVGFRQENFKAGYGIKNIQSRLDLYYGTKSEVLFHSSEGQGTQVTIRIPLHVEAGEQHPAEKDCL